jgi:ATP-dependent helicase/nuclease subunit A
VSRDQGGPALVDAPERQRALQGLDTSLLVEAAAGSGKTTLLLGRIVNLVRSGRARLAEIAAVTFTEKAATELRIRLRAELESAGLHEALQDLEAARIGTIHGFAGALLRERPVEAGVDPGFTVADPLMATLLRDSTWERWIDESLATPELAEPVRRAIQLGVGLDVLRGLADNLVDERDRLDGLPAVLLPPEPPADLDRDARRVIAALEGVAAAGAKDPGDRAASAVADLGGWARQTAALPEAARAGALLEAPLPESAKVGRLGNKTRWRSPAQLEEVRRALIGLGERVEKARAVERHNLVVALAGWARGFVDAYQARKARAGSLDFQDLLLLARNLVRDHPEVRRDFQSQIRYLLVDEFQDTDPLQLEMVLLLAQDAPPGSLFIVGDPKQSIYRFRRADIETYQDACQVVARLGEVLSVRVNFRSTRAILDAVNAVFEGRMVPPSDGAYQPPYVPLEPGPATAPGRALRLLQAPEDAPPPMSADAARADEARRVATYLRAEAVSGGLRYGQVAVLFRTMLAVTAYEDAFREAHIPFHTVGGRHYYDRSEVGWIIAALSAIEDPHDAVALVGALRSPFFGFPDEALLAFRRAGGTLSYHRPLPSGLDPARAPAWREAFAVLAELHEARNTVSPSVLVERLLVRTQALAAYALDDEGEARVANLLKVLDTARSLEQTGVVTFRGLVRWLRARGAARQEEEESSIAEDGEEVVRLLTVHRAKGLEFDLVVLADPGSTLPRRTGRLLGDRRSGRLAVDLGEAGGSPLRTMNWDDLVAHEEARSDAEALRLLYVALTRARRDLVIPLAAEAGPGSFMAELGPILEIAEPVVVPVGGSGVGRPEAPAEAPLDGTLAGWRTAREEARARGIGSPRVVRPSGDGPPTAPGTAAVRPRVRAAGRQLGALVHAALATVDLAKPAAAPEVVARLAARAGVTGETAGAARRLVERALASPVVKRARKSKWVARELPVTAEIDGQVVDGRVDLAFEERGKLVVVEFKVEAADAPDAPDAEEQVGLYAAALTKALGRPLKEALVVSLH